MGAFSEALASLNTVYYRTDRFEILDGEAGLVLPNELQANPMENTFFSLAVLRERRGGGEKSTNPGTVVVVDVHLRHTEAFAVRCVGRLREKITAWMEKYPGSGIVLLGEMNWDRTTKVYGALTAEAPPPSVALRDTLDYGKMAVGKGGSYHAFTGQADGAWPTDLIFCGGTFKVVGTAEILRDKGADGRYPTDHFLVEAAVGW
jgi:endonuclease/exonuclease/phosphatase family metal-dependent hydrolase